MHVCNRHEYVLVKIPKAGSNSLHRMMCDVVLSHAKNRGIEPPRIKYSAIHYTAKEIRDKIPKFWGRYFKFAFVRNPWDRWMSWYYYRTYHPTHGLNREYQGKPLEWLKRFGGKGKYNQYIWNQIDFLTDDGGDLMVDFIGSVGHFHRDFLRVCAHLQLPGARNRIINRGVREYCPNDYTPEVEKYIAKMCKKDINFFNFRPGLELEEPISAKDLHRRRGLEW